MKITLSAPCRPTVALSTLSPGDTFRFGGGEPSNCYILLSFGGISGNASVKSFATEAHYMVPGVRQIIKVKITAMTVEDE